MWFFKWLRYFQYLVFYASFLVWPMLIWGIWMIVVEGSWGWVLLAGCLLFIYMRWVEPEMIRVREEKLYLGKTGKFLRLVFVSDLHLGIFKGERYLRKVLGKIGKIKGIDLLILGGDLINDPTRKQLEEMFEPLRGINREVLAITGNHDAGVPGDFKSEEVRKALRSVGVTTIDNIIVRRNLAGREVTVLGVSDLMEGKIEWGLLDELGEETVNIVVAHNPDVALEMGEGSRLGLVICGHTHGGQIFLPPVSHWLIPCVGKFVRGWYKVKGHNVYVSSGAGEVVLPLRLMMPPEIVVMDIFV